MSKRQKITQEYMEELIQEYLEQCTLQEFTELYNFIFETNLKIEDVMESE